MSTTLCRECRRKPVSRKSGVFCGLQCMADHKARTHANLARVNLAKARAVQHAAYLQRACQRVTASDLLALQLLLSRGEVMPARRLLLRIEARGYRRGWCAARQRMRRAG